jgi:hypothetical protein
MFFTAVLACLKEDPHIYEGLVFYEDVMANPRRARKTGNLGNVVFFWRKNGK